VNINQRGIVSGFLKATDISISGLAPYFSIGKPLPVPAISIYVSGTLTDIESQLGNYKDSEISLYACAVPSGTNGPVSAVDLLSGYVLGGYGQLPCRKIEGSTLFPSHSTCTITKVSISGVPPTFTTISGNTYYDIYATHVLTTITDSKRVVAGYGTLQVLGGYLTQAPYPDLSELNSIIEDHGEVVTNNTLMTFVFRFPETLSLFANSGSFGAGYPDLAASGMIQMSCSGNYSGVYFPATYDGTNDNINPIYQYLQPSGTITWKIPKKFTVNPDVYGWYTFRLNYINSSGLLSPTVNIEFFSRQLRNFDQAIPALPDNYQIQDGDIAGPYVVTVEGETARSRISLGVRDIDLAVVQYNENGTYISSPYTSEKPIYGLSMEVNESAPKITNFNIWDMVKYYIQFDINDNGKWYQISPKPRINELDINGVNVPNIFLLDSNLFSNDKVLDIYNMISFIDLNKEQYNFRVKIELNTNITGSHGQWTPQIYDYKISVIDREALLASNYERYLFN